MNSNLTTDRDIEEGDLSLRQPKKSDPGLDKDILKIPRSTKALGKESQLSLIKKLLKDLKGTKVPDLDQKGLIRLASEFFVLDNKLWCKDRQGQHKLVIPENKRLELIHQVHDELGHKGVFTVKLRLGLLFWWPHMDDNVKWFIRTCHECQVCLVKKIVIPTMVAKPAGLFRKVYINKMLMPKAQGYQYIIHARCSLTS